MIEVVDTNDIIVHIFHQEKEIFTIWKKCGQKKFLKKRRQYEKNYINYFFIF